MFQFYYIDSFFIDGNYLVYGTVEFEGQSNAYFAKVNRYFNLTDIHEFGSIASKFKLTQDERHEFFRELQSFIKGQRVNILYDCRDYIHG